MKKFCGILIIILLLSSLIGVAFTGFNNFQYKKAIIMLPGFMGSMLIDEENIYWMTYPLYNDNYQEPKPSKKSLIARLFNVLLMDEDGNRSVDMYPPSVDDMDMVGGSYNEYLDIYNEIYKRFSNEYEVIHFQYDWMKSNIYNAQKLDEFICEKGYDEVILLSHSMGGLVADNYLALGSKQREKVSLYASFGSPHGGVVDTLVVLESKEWSGLPAVFSSLFGDMVFDITRNMPSHLQMLPNQILLNSPYYKNAEAGHSSFIRIETEPEVFEYLTSWDDIVNFYSSREWAKYITNSEKKGQQKQLFSEALDMFSRVYYKNNNGAYEHISQKVNSYYFVGKRDKSNAYACMQYNLDGSVTWLREKDYTDGTVSAPSAAAGFPLDYERVIYKNGHGHAAIFMEINEEKETPIDIVQQLILSL